jgi:hypothetical protein
MKTITINLYSFSELSKEGQKQALENLSDINFEGRDWWEQTYEDAENIGLKITSFDIDRANYCNGEFTLSAVEVAQNVLNEHGEHCETYKTAKTFLAEHSPVFAEYFEKEGTELEDKLTEIEDNFLQSLLEDYKVMLKNEYEYLQSDEAIKETIEANEYTFEADGTMNNG